MLSPLDHSLETGLPIRLVLTVSGNPNYTHKNDISTLGQGPSNQYWANTPPITRHYRAMPSASLRPSIVQPPMKDEIANVSEGFAHLDPYLADHMDGFPRNTASITTGVATGLASIVSNLELILNFINLRAEVREIHSPS